MILLFCHKEYIFPLKIKIDMDAGTLNNLSKYWWHDILGSTIQDSLLIPLTTWLLTTMRSNKGYSWQEVLEGVHNYCAVYSMDLEQLKQTLSTQAQHTHLQPSSQRNDCITFLPAVVEQLWLGFPSFLRSPFLRWPWALDLILFLSE